MIEKLQLFLPKKKASFPKNVAATLKKAASILGIICNGAMNQGFVSIVLVFLGK